MNSKTIEMVLILFNLPTHDLSRGLTIFSYEYSFLFVNRDAISLSFSELKIRGL